MHMQAFTTGEERLLKAEHQILLILDADLAILRDAKRLAVGLVRKACLLVNLRSSLQVTYEVMLGVSLFL